MVVVKMGILNGMTFSRMPVWYLYKSHAPKMHMQVGGAVKMRGLVCYWGIGAQNAGPFC